MSSSVFNVRAWGMSRLPRSVGQIRSARNPAVRRRSDLLLSVEQVARMVPEWGRWEVRYAGDDRPWSVRGL